MLNLSCLQTSIQEDLYERGMLKRKDEQIEVVDLAARREVLALERDKLQKNLGEINKTKEDLIKGV